MHVGKFPVPHAILAASRQPLTTPIVPDTPATFQDLILTLQEFWAERGCILQQPYDIEIGAGTAVPTWAFEGCHLLGCDGYAHDILE